MSKKQTQTLDDGKCDCCGKHILELKPFGGPGDHPSNDEYAGAMLVKNYRQLGPYVEEADRAVREAERFYKSDGFEDKHDWLIDKYGEERAEEFDLADYFYHDSLSFWECRDCRLLDLDEYWEEYEHKLERLGYPKDLYKRM